MRNYAFLLFVLVSIGRADNTVADPFALAQTNCSYSLVQPYSNCDVIGDESKYDIQKLTSTLASDESRVSLFFNYGNGGPAGPNTLAPFSDIGLTLGVGDLFFFNPNNPDQYLYGIPLYAHGAFQAGDIYRVGGGIGTATADDLIHNSSYYYRRNQTVRLNGSGAAAGSGTVSVSDYGNGVTAARYEVVVNFTTPAGFFEDLLSNGEIGVAFASAYCGNDVIAGSVDPVPEPASLVLLGGVALCLIPGLRKFAAR